MADAQQLEALRAELSYRRQKRDLYRAKTYGPRPSSPERMRELDRLVAEAEARLEHMVSTGTGGKPAS
jgi:DNA-binding transcriptional regulator YbjK